MSQAGEMVVPKPPLRGSPHRKTNFMEQFQLSYVRAVAAASGCITAEFSFDDGIDIEMHHKSDAHVSQPDRVARLEIQLKATHDDDPSSDFVTSSMRRDRWEYYRIPNATIPKIVVIMALPDDPEDWLRAGHEALLLHRCAYWVNLAKTPFTDAARPTIKASREQIFDDIALCDIMERIGAGGQP